ncbi:MAG: hypothetical protein HY874_08070 [Chloroflexi bacterium]|nr:hypothetical protein [Chloroflexota bacterium]
MPMVFVLALASIVINVFAADRVGLIDLDYVGLPGYLKDAKPPKAKLLEREHCCGGSADWSGVTQLFYGANEPFEQVVEHYTNEMTKRGFAAALVPPDRTWLSGETETTFEKPDDQACVSVAPFTSDYDLDKGLRSTDAESLRGRLEEFAHPYVLLFWEACQG